MSARSDPSAHDEPAGADTEAASRPERDAHGGQGVSGTPVVEWICAAFAVVLVISATGFIAYRGWTREDEPPQLSFTVNSIVAQKEAFLVTVNAVNHGGKTAADVKVEGELSGPGGIMEKSEMTFQYLPPNSERKGGLFFTHDPRRFKLELKARSYVAP